MCGKDGNGMTTKAGSWIRGCAPRQDKEEWSTLVATRCTQGCPEKRAYVRWERHPSKQDGLRPTRGHQGSPTCAQCGSRGVQDAREARVARIDGAAGGAESSAVGDRHGHA